MVDFSVAPIGLGDHRLVEACAAECRLQAISSGLANHERNPGVCIGKENKIWVMGFDKLHEIVEDLSLRSFQQLLAPSKYLDAGDLPGPGRISGHLLLQAGQRDLKIWREPGFFSVSAGKEVVLGEVALVLADVHIIKLGLVMGLNLDFLGRFAAGIDLVALEGAEDGSEAALLCFESMMQQ
jgi:hypothetical protein